MKLLEDIAKKVSNSKKSDKLISFSGKKNTVLEEEIQNAREDDLEKIINILFSSGIHVSPKIYKKLKNFQIYIGYGPKQHEFIGKLWEFIFYKIEKDKQLPFINYLTTIEGMEFWEMIKTFPYFFSQIELDPEFASEWFYKIAKKIQGDMGAGGFYEGLVKYSQNFPESGLKVFTRYIDHINNELKRSLSATILGVIRSKRSINKTFQDTIDKWDNKLRNNHDINYRICYYRSLLNSFELGVFNNSELLEYLIEMIERRTAKETDEAFNTLYRCLLGKLEDPVFISLAVKWFSDHASNDIPDLSKYCIADSVWRLCDSKRTKKRYLEINKANELLMRIQPIKIKHKGTWDRIEYYLIDRLSEGEDNVEKTINKLIESDQSDNFLTKLSKNDFSYFFSEINKLPKPSKMITNLIISRNPVKRKIGRTFYKSCKYEPIDSDILNKTDEKLLELLIFEYIQNPFLGEKTSQYFLTLEKVFRHRKDSLRDLFKSEMVFQGINYYGNCYEKWQHVKNKSKYLKEILLKIKSYFDNFDKSIDLPPRYIQAPSYKDYFIREQEQLSSTIKSEARSKSVMLSLIKSVEILYGTEFTTVVDNKISPESKMKEFRTSMEFPRVEILDPEGMLLRRLGVSSKIKELQKIINAN